MPGRILPPAFSRANLRKVMGKSSPLFEFLDYFSIRDVSFDKWDFNIKALDTTNQWTVAAGASSTTWAVRAEAGGWIRGVIGATAATSGLQLSIPTKYWSGDANAGMACLFRASNVTEKRIEIGFADALPSVNTTVVNSLSTPSYNTATDAALFVYDHTGTATTMGLYTAGTGFTAAKQAFTAPAPTAGGVYFVAVQLIGNRAYLFVKDGAGAVASANSGTTDYIEGGSGVIPVVSLKSSDTNTGNFDIDFIATWSGRLG